MDTHLDSSKFVTAAYTSTFGLPIPVQAWQMRGPYPGLGSALSAMGIHNGTLMALEIELALRDEGAEWTQDPWEMIDAAFENPDLLPAGARQHVGEFTRRLWLQLPDERRALLKLLSRLDLSADQPAPYYEPVERERHGIQCSDSDILENSYRIYELDRGRIDPVAVETID